MQLFAMLLIRVDMIVIHSMRFLKKLKVLFLITICLAPLSLNAQDDRDIKKVIISYNQGIIKAAQTSKTEHMKDFAKEDIVKKFHLWIKSWHDNNLFMEAKILDIDFKSVDIKDDRAFVLTDEKWVYRYIDIKVRKEVHKESNISYVIKYTLSNNSNKWIIEKIDVISEKQ